MNTKVKLFVPLAATMAILAACGSETSEQESKAIAPSIETSTETVDKDAIKVGEENVENAVEVEEADNVPVTNEASATTNTPATSAKTTNKTKSASAATKTVSSIVLDRNQDYSGFGDLLGTTDAVKANNLNKTEYYTNVKFVGKVKYLMPDRNNNVIGAVVEVGGNPDYSLVYVDFTKKNANDYNPANSITKTGLTGKYIYFEGEIKGFETHYGDETMLIPSVDLGKIQVGGFPVNSLDLATFNPGPQNAGSRDTIGYLNDGYLGDFIGVQVLGQAEWDEYTMNPPLKYSSVIKVAEFVTIENGQHQTIYSMVK